MQTKVTKKIHETENEIRQKQDALYQELKENKRVKENLDFKLKFFNKEIEAIEKQIDILDHRLELKEKL